MDKNKDGVISKEELKDWVAHVHSTYVTKDLERSWNTLPLNDKGQITWESYLKETFGESRDDKDLQLQGMIARDKRRWDACDVDDDNALSKDEYMAFLHPEDFKHMRSVLIEETIYDLDSDQDGKISLKEYLDQYGENRHDKEQQDSDTEQFKKYRDTNNDGYLDFEEVGEWVSPKDYDHTEAEANHLIYHSDTDKDGFLSKDEVLDHENVFIESQATDYGDALMKHEEL